MKRHTRQTILCWRGLSLLELLLAMSITAMVSAAIAGMLGAVSTGVGTRRDTRTVMVLANAAQSRLSAYVAPSQCILATDASGSDLVVWLNDSRQSGTVHATEIRWLLFDADAGTISVHYVDFPDEWTQAAKDIEDLEFASNTDWNLVLGHYQAKGQIASQPLIDGLQSLALSTDQAMAQTSRHVNYQLRFRTDSGQMAIAVTATIRQHTAPS